MYETGHSPSVEDLRRSLRRLERALAEHRRRLDEDDGAEGIARAMRRNLVLMEEEADRLRVLIACA